jgi:hypothetical protein
MSKHEIDEDCRAQPRPVVLTPSETKQVAGGINPQPLPPGEDRLSAKSE